MKSVARFVEMWRAVRFVDAFHHDNVVIIKELDGRFHVYDMGGK